MNDWAKIVKKFILSACRSRDILLRNNMSRNSDPKLYDESKQVQIDLLGINSNQSVADYLLKHYDTIYNILPKPNGGRHKIAQLINYRIQAIEISFKLMEVAS